MATTVGGENGEASEAGGEVGRGQGGGQHQVPRQHHHGQEVLKGKARGVLQCRNPAKGPCWQIAAMRISI
eukprot:8954572-Prorocentrum_lima.AAC.1